MNVYGKLNGRGDQGYVVRFGADDKAKACARTMPPCENLIIIDGMTVDEIENVQKAGFPLSLNIVGFAIDDDALAAQFEEWAGAGGGRYFAANDADGLSDAVTNALATPYTVYDQSGAAVATGIVGGEPLQLEQGVYRVVVATTPQRNFADVVVPGESTVNVEL